MEDKRKDIRRGGNGDGTGRKRRSCFGFKLIIIKSQVSRKWKCCEPLISKTNSVSSIARVYNIERVLNGPLPYRKHSRESNVIVTRPKTACYDVYTLIKTGIDRRCYFHLCPCLQEILNSEAREKLERSL